MADPQHISFKQEDRDLASKKATDTLRIEKVLSGLLDSIQRQDKWKNFQNINWQKMSALGWRHKR